MKKLTFLFFLVWILRAAVLSQPCLSEGITFSTQAQIDSFQVNFPFCTEIEGNVYISGGDITDLSELNVVTLIGGNLEIHDNDTLASFTGLEKLDAVYGDVWITYNHNLYDMAGLDNLTSVGGDLVIAGDHKLNNLTSLGQLTNIGGELHIGYWAGGGTAPHGNNSLTSLSGLESIESASITYLQIAFNNSLTTCEVQSVCEYLANPTGNISILNNAPGCDSQVEVEAACATVSVNEVSFSDQLIAHPNPFSTSTTIAYELQQPSTVQITIYNHLGKQIEVIQQTQSAGKQQVVWNSEGLPGGVYFCVLKTDPARSGQTMKMIKMK